jgi:hypothetical protein
MHFNARGFLVDNWGNPDKLLAFIEGYGVKKIRRSTINQWFRRGRLPTEWGMTLITLNKIETGKELNLEKYLIR